MPKNSILPTDLRVLRWHQGGNMMEIQALNMTVVWLVILVALVVIELLTMGLTTVWFAGGALAATLASLLG